MSGIGKRTFVFEEWKALAENNPEAFEFTRQRMIDSLIAEAEGSERLKRLQWRIDVERQRSKTPLSACVKLSNMMLDSLYGDSGLATILQGEYRSKAPADVVELQRQREKKPD